MAVHAETGMNRSEIKMVDKRPVSRSCHTLVGGKLIHLPSKDEQIPWYVTTLFWDTGRPGTTCA